MSRGSPVGVAGLGFILDSRRPGRGEIQDSNGEPLSDAEQRSFKRAGCCKHPGGISAALREEGGGWKERGRMLQEPVRSDCFGLVLNMP